MEGVVQQYAADAADLFGWTPDEVIGKMSVASFHVPENVPTLVPRLLREAVENGKFEEEVTLIRKDGARFPAVLTVRPLFRDGAQFHIPKNVPTLVPRLLREAMERGKFEERVTLMRKSGATFRAVLTVRPVIRDGGPIGFMGMTRPLGAPTKVPVGRLWFQSLRA